MSRRASPAAVPAPAAIPALAAVLALAALLAACGPSPVAGDGATALSPYPAARFAIVSDVHLYDADALGTEGPDFAAEVAGDRKMVAESAEILAEALERVAASGARFLLVAGDLTHEGQLASHERVAAMLAGLERDGVSVYVVPGNHDILNAEASGFGPQGRHRVETVTPEGFAALYAPFGYAEALRRDPASLSYLAEPAPGLWLLAVDACRYDENPADGAPVTGGRISPATLAWIEDVLADARDMGKQPIVLQHHGLVDHFGGQSRSFRDYLVEERERIARLFVEGGVRVAFTGHYHAQDVALARLGGATLFDVMTASLVTAPHVRHVTIGSDGTMEIRSEPIRSLPSFAAAGRDFGAWADAFVHERIAGIAIETMRGMTVPLEDALALAPRIADAFVANYRGDEGAVPAASRLSGRGLSLRGRVVVALQRRRIESLWRDPAPADNDLAIDLVTGSWRPLAR